MLSGQAVTLVVCQGPGIEEPHGSRPRGGWPTRKDPGESFRFGKLSIRARRSWGRHCHASRRIEPSVTPEKRERQNQGSGIPHCTPDNATNEGGRATCTASS